MTTTQNPNYKTLEKELEQNRQDLVKLIDIDPVFNSRILQAQFKERCLKLFDNSKNLFSYVQINTLIQIVAFAIRHHVSITKAEVITEFETFFDTNSHLLKVVYNSGLDVYETQLTNKTNGQTVHQEEVYFEDFAQIMGEIKSQARDSQAIKA